MHQHEQNGKKNLWLRNKINYVHQRYCGDKRRICEFSPYFFRSVLWFLFYFLCPCSKYMCNKPLPKSYVNVIWVCSTTTHRYENINLLSAATTRLTCELLSGRRVAPFDSNNKIIFLNLQIVHCR